MDATDIAVRVKGVIAHKLAEHARNAAHFERTSGLSLRQLLAAPPLEFEEACVLAGVEPSSRQLGKWLRGTGAAHKAWKEYTGG